MERYLGNGVYATYDGGDVVLDVRKQDNTTRITLEPYMLGILNRFVSGYECMTPTDVDGNVAAGSPGVFEPDLDEEDIEELRNIWTEGESEQ